MPGAVLPLLVRRGLGAKEPGESVSQACSYHPAFYAVTRSSHQHLDAAGHRREASIVRQTLGKAVVNLLNNHRNFEAGKSQIEHDLAHVAAGRERVAMN